MSHQPARRVAAGGVSGRLVEELDLVGWRVSQRHLTAKDLAPRSYGVAVRKPRLGGCL